MMQVRVRSAAVLLIVIASFAAAPAALATDYYADLTGGNWTTNTTWHLVSNSGPVAPAGTYPGSAPGDKAIIDFQGIAITLSAAVPNAVTIDFNNVSCSLTVNSGGSLPLTGASQVAGGTLLVMNGGTVNNAGTLTIGSTSSINWSSGTLTGSGSTAVSSGASVNATGTGMILSGGQDLNLTGNFTYGASASGFAVNSGAAVNILSGSTFDVQNFNGIGSDGTGVINVSSGGTFIKTNGNFGTNIDPVLNNNGLVQVNINSLVLNDGTHTGTFNMNGASTGIAILNTPALNGATITGGGTAALDHTTITGTVNATNITFDTFGSLSGSGTLNLSGTFTWAGGSISGITFNAQNTSTVNITGAANTSLASAAHMTVAGTMTINPGANFSIVSDAHLTNNGTINIAGDLTINSDGAPLARIDNLATRSINKTAGAGSAYIAVKLNNAGSVSSLSGLLKLQGGGTHTGSWGLGTGAALVFDGGTHQLTGGSFSGSTGTVGLNAGILDIDVPITLPAGIAFQQSGGTLTGAGNFTIPGTFLWTGGSMDNSSGSGQTILTGASSQIAGTTSTLTLSGRTISQTGTFTYNPTVGIELSIDDGGLFLNTGQFNIVGDAEIDSNQSGTPRFTNGVGGAINKSTGTGSADIYAVFRNLSSINLTSGSLALYGGGDDLGIVNFNSAANKIVIANGTFTLADQPGLNGAGAVSVDGAFATLGLSTSVTIPNLEILNGGTVAGGTLGVGTSLLWRQGKMLGGVTNIGNTATVDATSLTGAITLDTHSLTNNGTFNWNGTSFNFAMTNGSSLINNGTFNATGGGNLTGIPLSDAITNNGTFKKTGGATGTRIDPFFSNSGSLSSEVSGQSLIIAGGGSQSGGGTSSTNAGALLDFFSGTYTVSSGTSPFMGSGIFRVNGGTLAITGSMSIPSPATLNVQSGSLDVTGGATFQIFGGLTWTGGTLSGNGATRTTGGSIGNIAPTTLLDDHTLTVAGGTFSYLGTGSNLLTVSGTANLNVETGATIAMAAGSTITGTSADGLTIAGTLDVSAGIATVNSNGHLTVSTGAIATGGSGTLRIGANTFFITQGVITGTGAIAVNGGTLTVSSTPLTIPNLQLISGTVNGNAFITILGGSWTGGTLGGTAPVTAEITGNFTIGTGSVKTLGRNLIVNAGSTVTENDGLTFTGTATVTNSGTWNSLANIPLTCSACTGAFVNTGTYNRPGTAFVTHTVRFDNDGSFNLPAASAGLNLGAGGVHTGDFAVNGGALQLGGTHSFSPTSDITGSRDVAFLNTGVHQGTIVLGSPGALVVAAGASLTLNTAAPVSVARLSLSGDISGAANIQLNGPTFGGSWFSGTLGGTGTVTLAAGANFPIGGAGAKTLDSRTFVNNGVVTLSSSVATANGAAFTNNGTVTVGGAPAGTTFAVPFTTAGTAEFLDGTIGFTGGYTQTAGTTKLLGGSFSATSATFNAGSLIGTGTITGPVTNSGTISPGLSAGTITINGNLTLNPSSILNIEVGGTTPGTQYDQLIVTGGTANLGGLLDVTFINGFTPADGNTFDVVTWPARTGTFATVNLPAFPSGTLTPTYEPNAFRITADFVTDLAITKTGPATGAFGSNITFTITVTNNGPSAANGVVVTDPTPANLTFVSNSGDCTTAFPCALGTIASGATKTITATYTITGGAGSNITNTASVSSTDTDNAAANNVASHTFLVELSDLAVSKTGPTRAKPGDDITFTIAIANGGASAAANVMVNDPTPAGLTFLGNTGACTTAFPCSLGTIASGDTKTITAKYSISGTLAGSTVTNTASVTTTTTDDTTNNTSSASVLIDCLNEAPQDLSPSSTGAANGTLTWRGRGDSYIVYFGPAGSGCSSQFATTSSRSVPYANLVPGNSYEFRVESIVNGCPTRSSACVKFTVPVDCTVPAAPVARVVGQTTSAKTYSVEWDAVPGATHYVIDEALGPDFVGATRLTVQGTSQAFKHDVTTVPTAYFYRVFAFTGCVATPGPASSTVRVVIIPLPPKDGPNKSVNVPAGSTEVIVQEVFVPGQPGQNLFFTATTDRPWLSVRPEQGVLTPNGVNLEVFADPKNLPNGTFTASVIVTVTDGTSNVASHGVTTVTTPISVNLVTPITPVAAKPAASQYALIIPTAGHLGGIDSHWQSDIRVTNAGFKSARYKLTFTPSGGAALGVKETTITVDAGATTALDDIIRNWFGLGSLGDGANGMLEILPLDDPAVVSQSTVASSRTYNVSGQGTLGQYIPAVPFPSFIGRSLPGALPQILSLQQIAQNANYRTNVGLAEAAGAPVNAVVSIFSAGGQKLGEVPVNLAAGAQLQMNQLLATQNIELSDGRLEVKVTGGDGKITAYASVVDSNTQDPLLVSGTPLTNAGTNKFVLPGVANLDNQLASWRTDMRVFNYATTSQPATLTFYPFNNGPSKTAQVLLGAGQVMTLDNVLRSQFEVENSGGVVHLTTPNNASLVVTGRTYNQTAEGTYGQYVPAVTVDQATGNGGRALHILQVEDSTRYRTNVGLAEVTGKAATVELQVVLPDSKITPTVQIPLSANEFRQFNVIRELGLGNVYNARISIRVVDGDGRVTAYGSVIDELTQDPTYVPAQ